MLLFWQKQIHVDFTGKYFEERDPDLWRWQNSCLDWRKLGLDADLNNTTLWRRLTTGSGSDAMMTSIFFPFFSIFAVFPPRTPDLGRTRELRRSSADLLCSWRVLPTPTSTSSSTATACAYLWSSDLSQPFIRGSGRVRRSSPPRSEQFRSVVPLAVQFWRF